MLAVTVADDEVDLVSRLCWGAGIEGLEERPGDGGTTTLVVGTDRPDEVVALLGSRWPVRAVHEDQDVWVESWKPWARAVPVGDTVTIRPPWIARDERDGRIDLVIDPGRAWGHGAHPTTSMTAELMLATRLDGTAVLDVGCGSGVLAVVAASGGARRVVGVDIDPEAVVATRANAATNGVAALVEASTRPLADVEGRFDLVVANIGAATLAVLALQLDAHAADGARLLLSGLLEDQLAATLAAFRGWSVVDGRDRDGWVAVSLGRDPQSSRSSRSGS